MASPQTSYHLDVVTKYFFPVMAGIENNIANVYGNMDKKYWDIDLHTSNRIPQKSELLPNQALIRGIKVHRYPWHLLGFWPVINWQTTSAVCLHNFDVFPHSLILLYAWYRKFTHQRAPRIFLTPHGGFTPGWETFPWPVRIIKKFYQATLGQWLINNVVDGFRSVSQWEANESIKHGLKPHKIHVITNGIENEAYVDVNRLASPKIKKIVSQLSPYLLQIGRIHPIKNQATLIKSLYRLPKKLNLVLVGPITDQNYYQQLLELIHQYQLETRVHFMGVIEGVDKYYLLRHCLAYVHLALWESYCNTVHESMSQKCLCIVSQGTALEELVKNNFSGYTLPIYADDQLATKIRSLLTKDHPSEITRLRENAYQYTQGHAWTAISQQVQNMYLSYLTLIK